MRFVFIGTGALAVATARVLINRNHEVIIVERDRERIESFSESLDCGFICGDGSKPAILRETVPELTNVLFCLTGNDQTNIIASLVGRSLGFKRVVTKVEDPEFEHICLELGLEKSIVPARTMGRYLADFAEGSTIAELATMIKGDARLFSFIARDEDTGPVVELPLPSIARVICVYRDQEFMWPGPNLKLKTRDEVVIITDNKHIQALRDHWRPTAESAKSAETAAAPDAESTRSA